MSRARAIIRVMFLDGFKAAPGLMWAILVLTIVSGVAQAVFPLGFKVFVDAAVARDTGDLVVGVLMSGGLIVTYWLAGTYDAHLGFALVDRMALFVSTRIAERVNAVPSIEHFERPEYLQELDLIDQNRHLLCAGPRQTLTAVSSVVRGVVIVALLAGIHPALALLPIFGLGPTLAQARSARIRQKAEESAAEDKRLADELFILASTSGPAKELRIFGLVPELLARHENLSRKICDVTARAAARGALVAAAGWIIFVAGFLAGIVLAVERATAGDATAGDVVLAVVLAQQVRELLSLVANDVGVILTTSRTASRALWLVQYVADQPPPGALSPPDRLEEGITFNGVGFRYPGTEVDVVRDLHLSLPSGTSVAVVGENGAGKSTLIKLLCGLYRPTSGEITIDGVDLQAIRLNAWRRRTTATFQDFVSYELVASEAVGVGDLPRIDDLDAIERALERASASDVVTTLHDGLATKLGRSFVDGTDLSGGQSQQLALSRGMMRDEPLVLILDEPTASLDAEAEDALFRRYVEAARRAREQAGTITIMVTHRFSTVRSADLIVVMDRGSVVEVGSHSDLMASRGTYAELFRLQASAYV